METESGQVESLIARLKGERERRDALRAEYRIVSASRFHGLRMLWFSLKATLGWISPSDRYAAWSSGIAPGTGIGVPVSPVPTMASDLEGERHAEASLDFHTM